MRPPSQRRRTSAQEPTAEAEASSNLGMRVGGSRQG